MPFFLRLCVFIFGALVPTLAHPQSGVLEIPSNGTQLSGVGVISGWKCDAGTITVSLNGGERLPTVKGLPRNDTRGACRNSGYNGFVTYMNWAILGDGEHTAVAFDNGVEFARSTFEVATLGEKFVARASLWLRVPNFPSPGEETYFEWNQSTQHLEVVRSQDISDICLSQPSPATLGPAPAPTPLLLPPPLPCPPDQGGDFNGTYLIQFQHDYAELATYTCTAAGQPKSRYRTEEFPVSPVLRLMAVSGHPARSVRRTGSTSDNGHSTADLPASSPAALGQRVVRASGRIRQAARGASISFSCPNKWGNPQSSWPTYCPGMLQAATV